LDASVTDRAYKELFNRFDAASGGFSMMPKFPAPIISFFCSDTTFATGNEKALQMAEKTLLHMRLGGIYDHVGFGFHRYSTGQQMVAPSL
jgi:uncharacterized protein YyaL (SSP411 family)